MAGFIYTGSSLREISFPIGGIGTGSIGLSGTGRLIDWEIANRPDKRSLNGFSHLAVKVEEDGRVLDARVLNSDLQPSFMGDAGSERYNGYGFGPPRQTLAGVPHFREVEFDGHYPRAALRFLDETFPGQVCLEAWNPFIPLNDKDSSLPLAIFEIAVTNPADKARDYVVAFTLNNPLTRKTRYNEYAQSGKYHLMRLLSGCEPADDPEYGDLTLSVEAEKVSYQQNWYHGNWFDSLAIFWQDFTHPGDLKNRFYAPDGQEKKEKDAVATLAARVTVKPGQSETIRFVLAWNYPNAWNYWNPVKDDPCGCPSDSACCQTQPHHPKHPATWKNYYATLFQDSLATTQYLYANLQRLEQETRRFMAVLYRSSLPSEALEAVAANLSLLRSPTCLRLTDGSLYGFEGCHCHEGCCEGSCTHVWNYAYAFPYLFPRLERSMRDLDYRYNISDAGAMSFRLQLPIGRQRSAFRPCADGQMGGIIKVFREWKIAGDTDWLRSIWPAVRQSLEYAWSPENPDRWDPDQAGYFSGRQHHTLDMELFGPNSWLSGFYLAALDAGARMAEALGETASAGLYRRILERGKSWVNQNLFNGEYFSQKVDLRNEGILAQYSNDSLTGAGIREAYWNEEAGEMKYQIDNGSIIDQVLAQWHCDLVGLGEVFDRAKVRSALAAVYRYNYRASFRQVFNPCRLFALNDEAGTMICAWPDGHSRPVVPVPYCEETMPGFEYQAGIHMIMNGLEPEGLAVIRAVRRRFDGTARNPWNEFECGSNYARSMASYALLLAYSGFTCDMVRHHLGFKPLHPDGNQQYLWSVDQGWGELAMTSQQIRLTICGGQLQLSSLALPRSERVCSIFSDGQPVLFQHRNNELVLEEDLHLQQDDVLQLNLREGIA